MAPKWILCSFWTPWSSVWTAPCRTCDRRGRGFRRYPSLWVSARGKEWCKRIPDAGGEVRGTTNAGQTWGRGHRTSVEGMSKRRVVRCDHEIVTWYGERGPVALNDSTEEEYNFKQLTGPHSAPSHCLSFVATVSDTLIATIRQKIARMVVVGIFSAFNNSFEPLIQI